MSAQEAQLPQNQQLADLSDYFFTGNDYTIERKNAFIQGLIDTHTVFRAARIAGISKKTAYLWAEADPQFEQAWQDALESSSDDLETCMYERAKQKDTLAGIFLLKKYRPEFRDKVSLDVSGVQEQIELMMVRMGIDPRQLPQATTEFIDTGYSEAGAEYLPVENPHNLQFSPPSAEQQKDNVPRETSD